MFAAMEASLDNLTEATNCLTACAAGWLGELHGVRSED